MEILGPLHIPRERRLSVTCHTRGHLAVYDWEACKWLYADTLESTDVERPCVRCGKMPTEEGYDACLGYLPGVKSACCGHGVAGEILMKAKET